MLLKKIRLRNFRQYYGEQEVEFSIDPSKNITLFMGENGSGKTSLFIAINWVLYGDKEVKISGSIVSKKAIAEARKNGDSLVEMEVTLHFTHYGDIYILSRKKYYNVELDEEKTSEGPEMRKITSQGKEEPIHDPFIAINPILPPNVRTYFFFDGERIDEFSKPEHDKEVKNAVFNVLGIKAVERAIKHLSDYIRQQNKEHAKVATGHLKDLLEKKENLLHEIDNIKEKLSSLKNEKANLKTEIEEYKGRLREIKEIETLVRQRDELSSELVELRHKLTEVDDKLRSIVGKSYLIIGLSSILDNALELTKGSLQTANIIPIKYRKKILTEVLENGICICGRNIDEVIRNILIQKKAELNISKDSIGEELLHFLLETLPNIKKEGEESLKQLNKLFISRNEIINRLDQIKKRLDDISSSIKESDVEVARDLQVSLERKIEEKGAIDKEIEMYEDKLEKLNQEYNDLSTKIKKEEQKEARQSLISTKIELAEEILRVLNEAYEKMVLDSREQIEKKATEIFKKLISSKKHMYFRKVVLTEDYVLKLVDIYSDEEAKKDISAGERQILSLAFILAMAEVSGKEAPIVMDTPFGRLDEVHRKNILENMPYIARQLILFTTPSEMPDSLRSIIEDKIGKYYELNFDRHEMYTKIEEL